MHAVLVEGEEARGLQLVEQFLASGSLMPPTAAAVAASKRRHVDLIGALRAIRDHTADRTRLSNLSRPVIRPHHPGSSCGVAG